MSKAVRAEKTRERRAVKAGLWALVKDLDEARVLWSALQLFVETESAKAKPNRLLGSAEAVLSRINGEVMSLKEGDPE